MDYAINKSGSTGLLKVIKLTDWFDYEWEDFSTVKSKEDNKIVWFCSENEAVEWMLENFSNKLIDPKYFSATSHDGMYYID